MKEEAALQVGLQEKKPRNTKRFMRIKRDLLKQLTLKNAKTALFSDLVEDYMSMWLTKELLIEDIETRGTVVMYNNGGGQQGFKANDSVDKLYRINAQMLRLLSDLDIRTSTVIEERRLGEGGLEAGREDEL